MATSATKLQNKNRHLELLGQALRAARERTGISQEELASRAGLNRAYVGCVERGERNPTLGNLMALMEVTGEAPGDVLSPVHLEHRAAGPQGQPKAQQRGAAAVALESYSEMFGNALQMERKQVGLSQEELAADTGLSRVHLSQLESGRMNPSFLTTMRILEVLQVAPAVFFQHFTLHGPGASPMPDRRESKGVRHAAARAHKKPGAV